MEVVANICLALLHDTTPLAIIKIYLDVDLCESTKPTKSESKYLVTSRLSFVYTYACNFLFSEGILLLFFIALQKVHT